MYKTDLVIIGCGAVGAAIAREFSRFNINVMVVEKNNDLYGDASRANGSISSPGYGNPPGSLVSRLSHASRNKYDIISRDLEIPYVRRGTVQPAFNEDMMERLETRLEYAWQNGDYEVERLSREQLLDMEPTINPKVLGGLYSPRDAAVDDFQLVIAQAENAAENGVEFLLGAKVTDIEVSKGKVETVKTTKGDIKTTYVINAAGLHNDDISKMAEGEIDYVVKPRKGQYILYDMAQAGFVKHIIMPVPTAYSRGHCLVPTAHGQLLVGPTAEDREDKTDYSSEAAMIEEVITEVQEICPSLDLRTPLRCFAGNRPNRIPEGYHIGFSDKVKGMFIVSGIRSDGISNSLGIAEYVLHLFIEAGIELIPKKHFVRTRKGIIDFSKCSDAEREALIEKDPLYGHVICRCETVTEAEILQAIHRPMGARTVDGVKRRVRAGMGRCQGGFCGPRVLNILARELGVDPTEILKNDTGSPMIKETIRK